MSEVQSINIIEDAEGELRVSSLIIAGRTENEHASVLRNIREHQAELERFGRVGFEIAPFETAGGTQRREIALLNEPQSSLLMTFMRNSPVVVEFKVELIRQFYTMRQALSAPTGGKLLALAVIEAQAMLTAKDEQIAELTPRADAWDELASAEGDYEVADAAKILARAGIETGRQRLFGQLADMGWIFRGAAGKWAAYQSAVDSGYLAEKPQWHYHPKTGDKVLDPPQVRVTVRGLERLRVRLGSVLRAVEVAS